MIEKQRTLFDIKLKYQKVKWLSTLQKNDNLNAAKIEAIENKYKSMIVKTKERHVGVVRHYMAKIRKEKQIEEKL